MSDEYVNWLAQIVGGLRGREHLLSLLHNIEFTWSIPADFNRAADGKDMRLQYGMNECGIEPCSVLEMMVALCQRMEEFIHDDDYGNRALEFFDNMLDSLGLEPYSTADEIWIKVQRMLNREYNYKGDGSLFKIAHPWRDMREVEIWCQAMWFLDEVYFGRDADVP